MQHNNKHVEIIEEWTKSEKSKIDSVDIINLDKFGKRYRVIVYNNLSKYNIKFERKVAKLEIKLNNSGYKRFEVFSVPKYLKKILYDTCDLRNNIYEEIELKESK